MIRLSQWAAKRWVNKSLPVTHPVVGAKFYPFVVSRVREEAKTARSDRAESRNLITREVKIKYLQRGLEPPPTHEIHLAIELAVYDHAH